MIFYKNKTQGLNEGETTDIAICSELRKSQTDICWMLCASCRNLHSCLNFDFLLTFFCASSAVDDVVFPHSFVVT